MLDAIDRKDAPVHFRMTSLERSMLYLIASYENRTPSEMMRELIRDGAKQRGLFPEKDAAGRQQDATA